MAVISTIHGRPKSVGHIRMSYGRFDDAGGASGEINTNLRKCLCMMITHETRCYWRSTAPQRWRGGFCWNRGYNRRCADDGQGWNEALRRRCEYRIPGGYAPN